MRWLLPEYVEDILPPEAARIEFLRRRILDLFAGFGYQLVMPPMLEYVESLLTGTGHDMDLRTFKLVDQLSGRMMGLRADITPQVARLDAHLLNRKGVTRLCYCGSVLHTRPAGLAATRRRSRARATPRPRRCTPTPSGATRSSRSSTAASRPTARASRTAAT